MDRVGESVKEMTGASYKKSIRLNILLRLAQGGATLDDLKTKARTWGVSESTVNTYCGEVVDHIARAQK